MHEDTTDRETTGDALSAAVLSPFCIDALDEELIESLWIEEMFGEAALEQLADDWCRTQHSVAEIVERQRLAGVVVAPVVRLPVPASPASPVMFPSSGCRAA